MENNQQELGTDVILAIGAHPDDLEFGISGSVAAWVKSGSKVHYLICTDGSKGSEDRQMTSDELIKLRRNEQRDAAKILGVESVTFLDYEDGATEAGLSLKKDITEVIRKIKPDTVIAQDPIMVYNAEFGVINHNDHRNVGLAAMDAVYPLARDYLSFPELDKKGLKPHKVKDLLFMGNFDDRSNYYVDITETYEIKLEALSAHKSQVDINSVGKWLDESSKNLGEKSGFHRAEGFIRIHLFI